LRIRWNYGAARSKKFPGGICDAAAHFPNRIRIDLIERTPIAFLRNGTELALVDAHGVILVARAARLQFPIVTGLSENMPREERGKRMQTYRNS